MKWLVKFVQKCKLIPLLLGMREYLKLTIFRVYIFREFYEFWSIFQNSYTRSFFKNCIRENVYTPNMHRIHILQKRYTKKNNKKMRKKCWLIQLFIINQKQQFLHRELPVFPLILTETLAKCPLFNCRYLILSSLGLKFINSKTYYSQK